MLTMLTRHSKGAVAKGAVLSKIYDNFISRDEITRSKAIVTLMPVTRQLEKTKFFKQLLLKRGDNDGKQYFWAATYIVKQVSHSIAIDIHQANLNFRGRKARMDKRS